MRSSVVGKRDAQPEQRCAEAVVFEVVALSEMARQPSRPPSTQVKAKSFSAAKAEATARAVKAAAAIVVAAGQQKAYQTST